MQHKQWVIAQLTQWAETFRDTDYPDTEEEAQQEADAAYDHIIALIEAYETGDCSPEQYEEILFQLWQSQQGEEE